MSGVNDAELTSILSEVVVGNTMYESREVYLGLAQIEDNGIAVKKRRVEAFLALRPGLEGDAAERLRSFLNRTPPSSLPPPVSTEIFSSSREMLVEWRAELSVQMSAMERQLETLQQSTLTNLTILSEQFLTSIKSNPQRVRVVKTDGIVTVTNVDGGVYPGALVKVSERTVRAVALSLFATRLFEPARMRAVSMNGNCCVVDTESLRNFLLMAEAMRRRETELSDCDPLNGLAALGRFEQAEIMQPDIFSQLIRGEFSMGNVPEKVHVFSVWRSKLPATDALFDMFMVGEVIDSWAKFFAALFGEVVSIPWSTVFSELLTRITTGDMRNVEPTYLMDRFAIVLSEWCDLVRHPYVHAGVQSSFSASSARLLLRDLLRRVRSGAEGFNAWQSRKSKGLATICQQLG
jgi:hypothetical protein